MLKVTCKLVGVSPLGFSAPVKSVKEKNEKHDKFEERTWRERMHTDADGYVYMLPMALHNCLTDIGQYLGEKIKGKGASTWTKHFKAGIMITEPLRLGVKAEDVPGEKLFVPSDGKRGGGKRVWKTFPFLAKWETEAEIILLDQLLVDEPEQVKEYLQHAGRFVGLGFFRPARNGYWGRFNVENFATTKDM
jgi:hypothetical protein